MANSPLAREHSDGGVPVFRGDDVIVTSRGDPFRGATYGPTVFSVAGEEYEMDKYLGRGGEGQVYRVTHKQSGKRFAVKFGNRIGSSVNEVELLQKMPRELVKHRNFLTYAMLVLDVKAHFATTDHIIFMEHVPNGELFEMIMTKAHNETMSEGTSRRFVHDIINGMAECYRKRVTHRDLKPENLLLNESGTIIIIDLGFAKLVDAEEPEPLERITTVNGYGTEACRAPEVRACFNSDFITISYSDRWREEVREAFGRDLRPTDCVFTTSGWHGRFPILAAVEERKLRRHFPIKMKPNQPYDCERADIWSLATIAFEIHARRQAFYDGTRGVALHSDVNGLENTELWDRINSSGKYPEFPDGLVSFLNALWRYDPAERPTFEQLQGAIRGDAGVLSSFPGLAWLAQPVNDANDFIEELRKRLPNKTFKLPTEHKPKDEHVAELLANPFKLPSEHESKDEYEGLLPNNASKLPSEHESKDEHEGLLPNNVSKLPSEQESKDEHEGLLPNSAFELRSEHESKDEDEGVLPNNAFNAFSEQGSKHKDTEHAIRKKTPIACCRRCKASPWIPSYFLSKNFAKQL